MKGFSKILFGAAAMALSGTAAMAAVPTITFTNGQSGAAFTNTGAVNATYQPIPGETITYNNVLTYDARADADGNTGEPNYFAFSGDGTTMTFNFSTPVKIPSLAVDEFNHNGGGLTLHVFDALGNDLAGPVNLTTTGWTTLTNFAPYSNVSKLTIFGADAPNVDDIQVIVPEPASMGLLALSTIGLLSRRRKA